METPPQRTTQSPKPRGPLEETVNLWTEKSTYGIKVKAPAVTHCYTYSKISALHGASALLPYLLHRSPAVDLKEPNRKIAIELWQENDQELRVRIRNQALVPHGLNDPRDDDV